MGLPYHQADIREIEAKPGDQIGGILKISQGSRNFLRYGYGDLLRDDRKWRVIHRVWPGSQRLLLWGDPVTGAAYSRAFGFCGSDGCELMEPLTFKGRKGSGIAGDRCGYADQSLRPRWDWEKYLYTYRIWGRLMYNPDSEPDPWRRHLRHHFSEAAGAIESALASASRILPLMTTAHLPSAANNNYWPEMYWNQSLFDAEHPGPYSDTPSPKVFGNVSPLDPQLFARVNDYADELLTGKPSSKYSPVEVAKLIESYATAATNHLLSAQRHTKTAAAEYRRLALDTAIQAGLGKFFAAKLRSAVLYRLFEKTSDRSALRAAITEYRQARAAWADFANPAKDIYLADITVGEAPHLRGHWLDRLPAIDRDIDTLAAKLTESTPTAAQNAASAIARLQSPRNPLFVGAIHIPEKSFIPGQPATIHFIVRIPWEMQPAEVNLYYRHVNQAERFNVIEMNESHRHYFLAAIPGSYTDSPYPLQYYFEVKGPKEAYRFPGSLDDLMTQPYFLLRRA
jgi:hypothetical protein